MRLRTVFAFLAMALLASCAESERQVDQQAQVQQHDVQGHSESLAAESEFMERAADEKNAAE
jgi:outer membrane biogenesis lipoprotein LolB